MSKLQTDGLILGGFLLIIWGLRFIDFAWYKNALRSRYSIQPRRELKASRLLLAPFLHNNRRHLSANSLPLLVLGWLTMLPDRTTFWLVTVITVLISSFGIWFFGSKGSAHLGASGLVLGYFGYLLSRGFVNNDGAEILLAVVILAVYHGLVWQIIPRQKGISLAGHFFGFVGGFVSSLTIPTIEQTISQLNLWP